MKTLFFSRLFVALLLVGAFFSSCSENKTEASQASISKAALVATSLTDDNPSKTKSQETPPENVNITNNRTPLNNNNNVEYILQNF